MADEGGLPSWYTILGSILTKDPMFPMKAQAQYEQMKNRIQTQDLLNKPVSSMIETGRMQQINKPQGDEFTGPSEEPQTKWNQFEQPRVKFEEATLGTLPFYKLIQDTLAKQAPQIFQGAEGHQLIDFDPTTRKATVVHTVPKQAAPEKTKLLSPTDLQTHYDIAPNVAAEASRLWNKNDVEGYQQLMMGVKPKAKEKTEREFVPQAFETPEGEITWVRPGEKVPKGVKPFRQAPQTTPTQEENKADKDRKAASEILFGDPKNVLARGLIRQDYQSIPITDIEKKKALNKYSTMKKLWSDNVKNLIDEVLTDAGILAPAESKAEKDQYGFVVGEIKRAKDGKKYRYMGNNKWEKLPK